MTKKMANLRSGSKVLVDGISADVWKKKGDSVLCQWHTGDPVRRSDGSVMGWPQSGTHYEWIPIDSLRLSPVL